MPVDLECLPERRAEAAMTNEGQLMTMGAALGLMVLVGNMDTTVVRAELPAPAFVTVPAPAAEGCVHTVDKH